MSLLPSKPEASEPDDAEPRVIGVDSDDAEDVISALSSETARELLTELHEEPAPPSELSDRVDTSLQNTQYHLEKLQAAGAVSVVDTAYSAKGREMNVYAPADQPLVIFAGDDEKTTGLKAALSRLLGGAGLLALGSVVVQTLYGDTQDAASAPVVPDGSEGAGGTGNGDGGAVGGNGGDGGAAGGNGDGGAQPAQEEATRTVEPDAAPPGDDAARATETVHDVDATDVMVEGTATPDAEVTYNAAADGEELATEAINVTNATNESIAANVSDPVTTVTTEAGNETTDAAVQAADTAASTLPPGLLFFLGGALVLTVWLVVWYTSQ